VALDRIAVNADPQRLERRRDRLSLTAFHFLPIKEEAHRFAFVIVVYNRMTLDPHNSPSSKLPVTPYIYYCESIARSIENIGQLIEKIGHDELSRTKKKMGTGARLSLLILA
jgi:hypothetical protein